jgi:hypothetical protein
MAFEYLMAWYMLNKNLGKLVQNLERLQDFGYRELPKHYEEAAVIYIYVKGQLLNLNGYTLSPQKRRQFEDFSGILRDDYGGNKQAASEELSKKYRNTYFYYCMYTPYPLRLE